MIFSPNNIKVEIELAKKQASQNILTIIRKNAISGANKAMDRLHIKNEIMFALIEEAENYNIGKSMSEDMMLENIISCLRKLRLKKLEYEHC